MKKKIYPHFIKDRKTQENVPLILASGSAARKQILKDLGLIFTVDPANIDERSIAHNTADELVQKLALKKAEEIIKKYDTGVVLAADTMILCDDKIIGKPNDAEDATLILQTLSSKTHQVLTGFVLYDILNHRYIQKVSTSKVTFYNLSNKQIEKYIETKEPFGKAGAYALQGEGKTLVQHLHGKRSNVYGLPRKAFIQTLLELGFSG